MEPDYSYGFSTDRQLEEYLHYQTDNAVGYRWNERFATYTGMKVRGVDYADAESANDRRFTAYTISSVIVHLTKPYGLSIIVTVRPSPVELQMTLPINMFFLVLNTASAQILSSRSRPVCKCAMSMEVLMKTHPFLKVPLEPV